MNHREFVQTKKRKNLDREELKRRYAKYSFIAVFFVINVCHYYMVEELSSLTDWIHLSLTIIIFCGGAINFIIGG